MQSSLPKRNLFLVFITSISVLLFQNCGGGLSTLGNFSSQAQNFNSKSSPLMSLTNQKNGITNSVNVYSPSLITQGGKLVMYFGGWIVDGQQHDKVYRIECSSSTSCEGEPSIVLDSVALGLEHVNDPSVVKISENNYIMYVTAVLLGTAQKGLGASENQIFASTSSDGINWSRPQIVISDLWLPASTIDANSNVLAYGDNNETAVGHALIYQYNLGKDGKTFVSRRPCSIPRGYQNIDVRWNSSQQIFEMVGETFEVTGNQIDYLTSVDGLNWSLSGEPVVRASSDPTKPSHVRTPAFDPSSAGYVFYAETRDVQNSMSNQIYSVPLRGAKSCSASSSDQEYILNSEDFFAAALKTSAAAKASDCNNRLQSAIATLSSQSWPCDLTKKVVEQIKICVDDVTALARGPVSTAQNTNTQNSNVPSVNACVASASDQEYLKTAVKFFDEAATTAGAAQAAACNANLKQNLKDLSAEKWPCASTVTTIEYIRTCVGVVTAQANASK